MFEGSSLFKVTAYSDELGKECTVWENSLTACKEKLDMLLINYSIIEAIGYERSKGRWTE